MSTESMSLTRLSIRLSAEPCPEAELVARAVRGDAEAFGDLYERYLDAIYRYVAARVGNTAEAEDLTETVFLKVWEALPRYDARGLQFRALVYRVAHNLLVDFYRTHHREEPFESVAGGTHDGEPESGTIAGERAACLSAALAQLDPAQQQVVSLRFIAGMSHAETAQVIGKSGGAVRVLQHRALAALRLLLKKGSGDEW